MIMQVKNYTSKYIRKENMLKPVYKCIAYTTFTSSFTYFKFLDLITSSKNGIKRTCSSAKCLPSPGKVAIYAYLCSLCFYFY
ncbi:hypothetical protein AQUCO_02700165v1 [Aquilegia coerulea]|uniref:Uncharacterized protein n=1 Tax=Aquilegia coerulea TaxID=218851 RepID=A0A2G5D6D9_AQUCA|nr:hypothetical protein AQUCO_02700165v1 [Aquilegia coerulea]